MDSIELKSYYITRNIYALSINALYVIFLELRVKTLDVKTKEPYSNSLLCSVKGSNEFSLLGDKYPFSKKYLKSDYIICTCGQTSRYRFGLLTEILSFIVSMK